MDVVSGGVRSAKVATVQLPLVVHGREAGGHDGERRGFTFHHCDVGRLLIDRGRERKGHPGRAEMRGRDRSFENESARTVRSHPRQAQVVAAATFLLQRLDEGALAGDEVDGAIGVVRTIGRQVGIHRWEQRRRVGAAFGRRPLARTVPLVLSGHERFAGGILGLAQIEKALVVATDIEGVAARERCDEHGAEPLAVAIGKVDRRFKGGCQQIARRRAVREVDRVRQVTHRAAPDAGEHFAVDAHDVLSSNETRRAEGGEGEEQVGESCITQAERSVEGVHQGSIFHA